MIEKITPANRVTESLWFIRGRASYVLKSVIVLGFETLFCLPAERIFELNRPGLLPGVGINQDPIASSEIEGRECVAAEIEHKAVDGKRFTLSGIGAALWAWSGYPWPNFQEVVSLRMHDCEGYDGDDRACESRFPGFAVEVRRLTRYFPVCVTLYYQAGIVEIRLHSWRKRSSCGQVNAFQDPGARKPRLQGCFRGLSWRNSDLRVRGETSITEKPEEKYRLNAITEVHRGAHNLSYRAWKKSPIQPPPHEKLNSALKFGPDFMELRAYRHPDTIPGWTRS